MLCLSCLMLLLTASSPLAPSTSAASLIPSDLQQNVREAVDNGYSVGMVVGMVDPNGASWFCYGKPSKGSAQSVEPNTVYEIGSVTKVFTALLLADLTRQGKVRLDDPVDQYLPPDVHAPARGDRKITLRLLANHTSGLPRMPTNFSPKDSNDPYADYDAQHLYLFLKGCKLTRDIGSKYEYSNLGAGLLGHTLSRAAGQPYEQLIIDHLCRPLGMPDTCIRLTDALRARLATGYDDDGNPTSNWNFDTIAGAGAIRSCGRDMLRFVAVNLGFVDTPLRPVLDMVRQGRTDTEMAGVFVALGWHIHTRHGTEIFWHNGGTGGYRSFCAFAPSKKLGVIVLSNSGTDGAGTDEMGLHALEPKYALRKVRKVVSVPTDVLETYVGYYQLKPEVIFSVRREGNRLLARLTGQAEYPVYAEDTQHFFYKIVDAQLEFVKGADGKVTALVLHQNNMNQKATKLGPEYRPPAPPREITLDGSVLAKYVGKYKMFDGDLFDVTLSDGRLMVQLADQPSIRFFPSSETEFFCKEVEAKIVFVREKDGTISRLYLHQSGAKVMAKRVE